MKNLEEFYYLTVLDLLTLKIPIQKSTFSVNPRLTSSWGQCKQLEDGSFHISISPKLVSDSAPDSALKITLIHELLHTCPDCMNHGQRWQLYAEKVRYRLHYDITTKVNFKELGLSPEKLPEKSPLPVRQEKHPLPAVGLCASKP